MDKRKAEIAAKRAKLEELRRAREERARSSAATTAPPSRSSTPSTTTTAAAARADVDALVRDLVDRPSTRQSTSEKSAQDAQEERTLSPPPPSKQQPPQSASIQPRDDSKHDQVQEADDAVQTEPPPVSVPVKITYDKAIQTAQLDSDDGIHDGESNMDQAGGAGKESEQEMRARILEELEQERRRLDLQLADEQARLDAEREQQRLKPLPNDELASYLTRPDFLEFLDTSTKVVQRALSDPYDYLRDYTITADDGQDSKDKSRIRLFGKWYDDRLNKGRSVTALDWSSHFHELFATAYNRNPLSVNDPDGIVCVWNLHLSDRPEFVFYAQSDVLSIAFNPFNPNTIVGGTYSGQIVLWDTRSRNPNPVLKTPLNATGGHTHPIYSVAVVGSQNAHNLVSASTDGTVCAWALDMLARPQESVELTQSNHTKTDEVGVTCLAFPEGESATCFVGTEEGNVHAAHRYDRAGAKAGIVPNETYRGHSGPVTALDFHPVAGPIDLSNLFLTSGVDWTVKLWRTGAAPTTANPSPAAVKTSSNGTAYTTSSSQATSKNGVLSSSTTGSDREPLLSFEEASDYVFDVRWHPRHPAVFGTADGSGRFNFWNLNVETEVPLVSTQVGDDEGSSSATRAVGKLKWDKDQGRKVAVGSANGTTYVYDVHLDLVTPQESDWERMRKLIQDVSR